MKKVLNRVVKKIAFTVFFCYSMIQLPILYSINHRGGQLSYLSEQDYKMWKRAFLSLLKTHYRTNYGLAQHKMFAAFATTKINIIRHREYSNCENPIVVLCVKNDLCRLKMLVNHYRNLGVERFAFLDNGSTDGTLEWMTEQQDIDLYSTDKAYSSFVKEAWINRIVSYYGVDRWYILTDSDELLSYIGMEKHSLKDVVQCATQSGFSRVKALTLDMYANAELFSGSIDESDIGKAYCWMDSDSYIEEKRVIGDSEIVALVGGPRMRMMNVTPSLMKYPLVFFKEGMISSNAHFQFPYKEIPDDTCYLAILHYKFMENDKEEYIKRASSNSGFSSGVALKNGGYYRHYMDIVNSQEKVSFMYEGSVMYSDSNSLKSIKLIKEFSF
ncbi:MAG: glycosyltransferase family 2 protein [Lachnospiraceae bacterium]|nr:glycosyltransferase family 2 protein [Lachnospiraceae bacterium]